MKTFINQSDEGLALQLVNFCSKIDGYTTTLGLDPLKVAAVKADSLYFNYVLAAQDNFKSYTQFVTKYKDHLRYGDGTAPLLNFPQVPVLATPPALVEANMQKRFADLIQDCVRSSNFSSGIGEELGILAPETPFVPEDGKPAINTSFSSGGHPHLKWKKGDYDGIEIWKDSGTGYKSYDKDFKPDYTDKADLPAVGQSAVWKYKAIYLYKEQQVGNWSDEVVVTVTGAV